MEVQRPQPATAFENGTSIDSCHLLRLPAEIRNDIFERALADESCRTVDIWPPYMSYNQAPPGLTLVNRQLREETLPKYRNQETVCVFAYMHQRWQESKAWLTKRQEAEYLIREMKIVFTKYAGDILILQGCVGKKPTYELILNAPRGRRIGDYNYDEDDLRAFVESQIKDLMKAGEKDGFGVDDFTRFGDLFLDKYYDF